MNEFEKAQIQRQLLLRDASVRPQPAAQQRPTSFHRVDMHFMEAIPVIISRVFALAMIDALPLITPRLPVGYRYRTHPYRLHVPGGNRRFKDRLNGDLFHIFQHANDHLSAPLDHAKDGWFFSRQCSPTPSPLQSTATTGTTLLADSVGISLVPGDDIDFVALYLPA